MAKKRKAAGATLGAGIAFVLFGIIFFCVSMGITVDGKDPRDAQKAVDAGEYDDILVE